MELSVTGGHTHKRDPGGDAESSRRSVVPGWRGGGGFAFNTTTLPEDCFRLHGSTPHPGTWVESHVSLAVLHVNWSPSQHSERGTGKGKPTHSGGGEKCHANRDVHVTHRKPSLVHTSFSSLAHSAFRAVIFSSLSLASFRRSRRTTLARCSGGNEGTGISREFRSTRRDSQAPEQPPDARTPQAG